MEDEKVEDLLPSLPRALKVLRESRRLDQDELVRLVAKKHESVGRAAIARYEAGKRSPSLETLRWLMGALDVTWEELGRALAAARKGDTGSFLNEAFSSEKPEISSKLLKPKGTAESRPKKSNKRPRKLERRPERPDSEDEQKAK